MKPETAIPKFPNQKSEVIGGAGESAARRNGVQGGMRIVESAASLAQPATPKKIPHRVTMRDLVGMIVVG